MRLKILAVNFSRTELELLVNAVEIAGQSGWPTGDDRLRVQVLRKQLEKAIADLRAQGWQGDCDTLEDVNPAFGDKYLAVVTTKQ